MDKKIESLKRTRENLLNFINDLTTDQLNEIPAGFNNNIIWNLGHLLASQQGICYTRAGLDKKIKEQYFTDYKPETKPQGYVDSLVLDELKKLFLSLIELFELDFNNNQFSSYPTWTTRYGMVITNIDEAITFVLFHEGLHLGYIMALKRLVTK